VRDDNVPPHLKDSSLASPEDKAKSRAYKYPHDYGGYVEQQYLPDALKDKIYYVPSENGYEKEVAEIRKRKGKKN
jgi:putative ATPase